MKESSFRFSVLSKLPSSIHRQPMLASGLGTAGTPDTYIDAKRDLWVEWKVVSGEDYFPRQLNNKYLPTALQDLWLSRRFENGGNAVVMVGFKLRGRAHGVILATPEEWRGPVSRETYEPMLLPAAKLAQYIEERVT